ncbi:MAG: hypothetical protein WCJ18_00970 [Planctomycetota bacterium]
MLPRYRRAVNGRTGAGSESPAPRIHQIYYDPPQRELLDPAFLPYSNVSNERPEWREYHIFRKEYLAGSCDQGITGFVSWKFGQKTGISGAQFRDWIERLPGYDVYFVNPFPLPQFRNVWCHGDLCHPGITEISQMLFHRVGLRTDLASLRMDRRHTAYCNYWAATPQFWDRYMAFCEPLHDLIEHRLEPAVRARLMQRADAVTEAPYIPYIFERLFSTLICIDQRIRAIGMPLPEADRRPRRSVMNTIFREVARPLRQLRQGRPRAA